MSSIQRTGKPFVVGIALLLLLGAPRCPNQNVRTTSVHRPGTATGSGVVLPGAPRRRHPDLVTVDPALLRAVSKSRPQPTDNVLLRPSYFSFREYQARESRIWHDAIERAIRQSPLRVRRWLGGGSPAQDRDVSIQLLCFYSESFAARNQLPTERDYAEFLLTQALPYGRLVNALEAKSHVENVVALAALNAQREISPREFNQRMRILYRCSQ